MTDQHSAAFSEMLRIGLKDRFIQGIVGLVAIAAAVSVALSTFGDGKKTIIGVALALIFGVVLVVFRVLVTNVDNTLIKWTCILSSATITGVFLIFAILAIPAVTFCWPPLYSEFLGLNSCLARKQEGSKAAFADLTDQNDNPVAIYPLSLFAKREKATDRAIYTWGERDNRTVMTVQTVPDGSGADLLRSEFDVLRKTNSKNHTYCLLKEKIFIVAFIEFDNRIRYTVGRRKNGMVTLIRIQYDADLKREFDAFLSGDLLQYFVGDLRHTKTIQNVCSDV